MRQFWLILRNGFHVCLCLLIYLTLDTPDAGAASEDVKAGKAIYNRACVSCHGPDGRGGSMTGMLQVKPRDLADRSYMKTRSTDQLFNVIKHGGSAEGLSSAMPGFADQLTDAQIHDTVAYVQTLSTAAPLATDAPATAPQTPAVERIARMRLSIWPEYDDPRVLVIIRGELDPSHALPAVLNLPIPKGAELIGAGMISDQNALLNHPHQIIPGDTHDTLSLTLPVSGFFAEWYYDPWTSREPNRQLTYTFTTPYRIEQLEVDIQQPYEATDFSTTPEAMGQNEDARGGKYALFSYRDLAANTPLTFTVRYVKDTDQPSVAKQQPMPEGDVADAALRQKTVLAFGLLVGFAGIYAGCVIAWRNRKRHRTSPGTATSHATAWATSPAGAPRPNFCPNCGRKRQPTDRFCSGCGQSLHRA